MTFWAHSDPEHLSPEEPGSRWQLLEEHLQNAGRLARHLAQLAAPSFTHLHDLAEWCGLLHDYGKYTDCFQRMITGQGKGPCPHAIHGAAVAYGKLQAPHVATVIAGHHAGLSDLGELRDKVNKASTDAFALLTRAATDFPAIGNLLASAPSLENVGKRFDLVTRLLLSCLVDADRLDTAGRPLIQSPLQAESRLATLLCYLNDLAANSPEGAVNTARQQVLADCLRAASFRDNIFSLSVPTGGGKTLSAMAFALQRAALQPDRYRRIIVVIPYLSIIEQNAEVYARVFGADSILEHHSGSFAKLTVRDEHFEPVTDEAGQYQPPWKRPETENWDAPLVVTTSVRFFESLFSNHPSDLRRVHNIARSIVILDEVQVLPRPLLGPLLGMMDELCRDWDCAFLLSTATKPAFERTEAADKNDLRWPSGRVREIVTDPAELHRTLRRVSIDWRIHEPVDWPQVAAWIRQERQSLCVVNLRDHAVVLFDELEPFIPKDALFHLSTRMCPAHRLEVLAAIKARLRQNLPCSVVSTQLIEAGVDVDFPVAFRALGPLDSIVQVAGRADREGRLTAEFGRPAGRLVVFKPLHHKTPPNEYETATALTEILAKTRSIQPEDLSTMEQFFESYYGGADLGSALQKMRDACQFRTLADEFEMINSRSQDVYVPYGEGKQWIDELYKVGQLTAYLRRRLQRFTVGLRPWEFQKAKTTVLSELSEGSNVWIATGAAYDEIKGLRAAADSEQLIA